MNTEAAELISTMTKINRNSKPVTEIAVSQNDDERTKHNNKHSARIGDCKHCGDRSDLHLDTLTVNKV